MKNRQSNPNGENAHTEVRRDLPLLSPIEQIKEGADSVSAPPQYKQNTPLDVRTCSLLSAVSDRSEESDFDFTPPKLGNLIGP